MVWALWHGAFPGHCFLVGYFPIRLLCLGASFNQLHWRDLKGRNNALSADIYIYIYIYIYIWLLTTGDRGPFRSLRNSSVKLGALKEYSLNKLDNCSHKVEHSYFSHLAQPSYVFIYIYIYIYIWWMSVGHACWESARPAGSGNIWVVFLPTCGLSRRQICFASHIYIYIYVYISNFIQWILLYCTELYRTVS